MKKSKSLAEWRKTDAGKKAYQAMVKAGDADSKRLTRRPIKLADWIRPVG